ncbi:MAG: hypothetical protein ACTSRW_00555 [Candidatus Helarchaeota archaeon]
MSDEEKTEEETEVVEGEEILRERERLKKLGLENASESAFDRITNVDPEMAEKMKKEEEEKQARKFIGFE